MRTLRLSTCALAALVIGSITACTEPKPPGSVWVTYSTNPGDESQFNWLLSVDSRTPAVISSEATSSIRFDSLTAGGHRLIIGGLPAMCTTGDDDRDIDIPAGDTLRVSLRVTCTRTTGDISVTIVTTGVDFDEDGYTLLLDGEPKATIPPTSFYTRALNKVPPGAHTLSLSGVAKNCSIISGQSPVTVNAGVGVPVTLSVKCVTTSGAVRVTTSTSGGTSLADPNGYQLTIGSLKTFIPASGTITIPVREGDYNAQIADIEPNCSAATASKPVSVTAGATTDVAFSVACGEYPATTAALSATDPAADTLPNSANGPANSWDIVNVTTRYATGFMTIALKFNRAIGSGEALVGYIDLDLDENAGTGVAPVMNSFGGSAPQGVDARVVFDLTPTPFSALSTATSFASIRMVVAGDSVLFHVPMSRLEDDGNMTITAIVGPDDRPTDFVPNAGVLLSRVPASVSLMRASRRIESGDVVRNAIAAPAWPVRPPPR